MRLILSGRINIWRTFCFDAFEWCHRNLPAAGLMNALSRGDLTIGWKRNQNLASLNKTGFNRYIQEDKVTTGNLVLSGALLFQLTRHILEIYFSPETVTFSLESFHLTSWIFLEMQKILTKISSHFWNGKKFCRTWTFLFLPASFPLSSCACVLE